MKLHKFFFLLLALPLFIAGCSNDPDVQGFQLSLTMESDVINFEAEGGNGIITYTLTNAPKDAKVEVSCDADWVSNLKAGTNIVFSVLPNENQARSTQIVVSYKDQSFTVTINQAAMSYVYDITFTSAERYPLVGQYPDNYIYVILTEETNTYLATLLLVCDEDKNILSAGIYDDANGNTIAQENCIYIIDSETEIAFETCLNYIVVEGDINNYSIVGKFTDPDNNVYRLKFNGAIDKMAENINHIESKETVFEANFVNGRYWDQAISNTYNYTIYLSDLDLIDGSYYAPNGKYYCVDLYGEEPVIDDEGYLIVPNGTYTVNDNYAYEDWSIGIEYCFYMVRNADSSGAYAHAFYETATITVTDERTVLEVTILGAKHTVTYNGTLKFFVGIEEPIADREFVANELFGMYYGNEYSEAYNCEVTLTDLGFTEDLEVIPNATYYTIDFYCVEPEIDADGYVTIPYGTYTYDKRNTYAEWTFSKRYSGYTVINADASDYVHDESFDEATVVVTDAGITLTAKINGGNHTAVYNGAPKFYAGQTRAAQRQKGSFRL